MRNGYRPILTGSPASAKNYCVGLIGCWKDSAARRAATPLLPGNYGRQRTNCSRPVFWVLFGTFFICGASTSGLIQTHFVTLCGDYGILPVAAAGVLAMMGIFDLAGTMGSGWLSDRYDNRWLLFWYYGLRGLSLLYLPFTGFTFYGLTLFAMFYGLDWIATIPPTLKLTGDRFGSERANVVFGWMFTGHQLGSGAVALGAGMSRTLYASYLPAFFLSGAFCLIAALLVMSIAKPKPRLQPKPA